MFFSDILRQSSTTMHGIPITLAGKCRPLLQRTWRSLSTKIRPRLLQNHTHVRLNNSALNILQVAKVRKSHISTSTALANEVQISPKQAEELEAKHILENMLTEEEHKKLAVIRLEIEICRANGSLIPQEIKNVMWIELLRNCPTTSSRRKRYTFWAKREFVKINKEEKKANKPSPIYADLDDAYHNKLIQRVNANATLDYNLVFSLMHGPHVVFDMGYSMVAKELSYLTKQLSSCHGINRVEREPFHLHFCNLCPSSDVSKTIDRRFPELRSMFYYTMTEQSYLDCYPPENLVYLSPDARDVLEEFSYDDVYIIGGLVDTGSSGPHSYMKARKEKIRSARLPLEKYVRYVS